MLRLLNYDLRFFTDARNGARALVTDPTPDLILIDLNMPEVSGIELLDFIRSKPRLNEPARGDYLSRNLASRGRKCPPAWSGRLPFQADLRGGNEDRD